MRNKRGDNEGSQTLFSLAFKKGALSLVRGQTEERLFRPKCPMAIRLLTEPFRAEVTDEIWFGVVLLGQSDAY